MIQVREATTTDAPHIVRFQLKMAFETEQLHLNEAIVEQGVAAVFADPSKGTYYVAEENGQVIASLLTTFEWSDWRNGTVLWIQSVFVEEPFRQKGVYSAMYRHIKSKVEQASHLKGIRLYVETNNRRAQAVYERSGMTAEHYQLYEWLKD